MRILRRASITVLLLLFLCIGFSGDAFGKFVLAPGNPNSPYGYDPRIDLPKNPEMVNEPYLGLGIRYTKKYGALVNGIRPGPMEGTMERSPYCDRGDIVESIDGQPISREVYRKVLASKKPGETVTLKFLRTNPDVSTMLPTPGKDRKPSEAVITLGRMSEWSGPAADVLKDKELPDIDALIPDAPKNTAAEKFLKDKLKKLEILAPVEKLKQTFWQDFCRPNYSRNMVPQVAYAFKYPLRLIELQNAIMQPIKRLPEDPASIYEVIARNLNLKVPPLGPNLNLEDTEVALDVLSRLMTKADDLIKNAFSKFNEQQKETLKTLTFGMLDNLSRHEWIMRLSDPVPYIAVTQASSYVDLQSLIDAAALFSGAITKNNPPKSVVPAQDLGELRNYVQGDILAARKVNGHWIVYGGPGENVYDMDHIDVVIDPGGNDTYFCDTNTRGLKVIVDMQGNDTYGATNRPIQKHAADGPAAGAFGVSLVVDYQGDDIYVQKSQGGIGSGIFGIGILVDYQGQDQYTGRSWSIGAGVYGAGVVLDLGDESDVYKSISCSQGLGCSRGFGLLLDKAGRELYQTGGVPGVYRVSGTSLSMSQGAGFSIFGYDVGGMGILFDLGGNDRYLGGEFSQGCGYGQAFGILYDREGNDLYYADRYSQGSAAHQALGILVDEKGDDTYYAISEVCQGGSWDASIGVLLDRSGNDSYVSSGTCQGGASMQGIGWLIDLGGQDRYSSQNQRSQGSSSENDYSYEETGCYSFSWLFDSGGNDSYSQPRQNNSMKTIGEVNTEDPEKSRLHGLFVDTSRPVRFWDFK